MRSSSSSSSFSLVSLSFSLVLFFFVIHGVNGSYMTIRDTCKKAAKSNPNLNYPFCVKSLKANVPTNKTINVADLGIISTDLAISDANSINLDINNLLKNQENGVDGNKALKDCLEVYLDAIPQLNDVKKAFLSKDYSTANIKMSAAMDASSTCQDGLKEKDLTLFSLSKKNEDFSQLASITLAITNLVH